MLRRLATAALVSTLLVATAGGEEPAWAGLPKDLRDGWREVVEAARELAYLPDGDYDALLRRLDAAKTPEDARALLRDLTQLNFDHDAGTSWLARLAHELERDELRPLGAAAWPARVEVDRVELRDGTSVVGTGGPLRRRYPQFTQEQLGGQRYLEPNLGLEGLGNWNLAGEDVRRAERTQVTVPRLVLLRAIEETIDAEGRLAVSGAWSVPGEGVSTRIVRLPVVRITPGGTLFAAPDLGLQCVLPTHLFPDLARHPAAPAGLAEAVGWDPPSWPERSDAEETRLATLLERIDALRERAPDVAWPEPCEPPDERVTAALARADLRHDDPRVELQRLRLALTYGDDLPATALADPAAFLATEARVRSVLRGDAAPDTLATGGDWATIAAHVRHAPDFDPPPAAGPYAGALVRFPPGYCGWRRFPLLVVLHGQYGQPDYDFGIWSDLAADAGMILVCPTFGGPDGAPRDRADDERVLGVVRTLQLRHNVDPDRVYVTGISMGGAKTWSLASTHTDRFAAAAPEIHGPAWKTLDRSRNLTFPLLPNLRHLPLQVLEGRFDGLNAANSRAAVTALRALREKDVAVPLVHREADLIGHERQAWRYPHLLRWFADQRRPPSPAATSVFALNAHRAHRAWLSIVKTRTGAGFAAEDGGFSPRALTGVSATASPGRIELRIETGAPQEVELRWDPPSMGDGPIEIRLGTRRVRTWKPQPDVRKLLDEVLRTGDRTRLYPDSIRVRVPAR